MSGVPQPKQGTKPRKASNKTNKDAATTLHAKIVKHDAGWQCQAAGWFDLECFGPMECAHIISRGWVTTRTDLANARCLCLRHHHHIDDFHLMRELVGAELHDMLILKAKRGIREWSGLTPTMWWRSERERLTEIARAKGII